MSVHAIIYFLRIKIRDIFLCIKSNWETCESPSILPVNKGKVKMHLDRSYSIQCGISVFGWKTNNFENYVTNFSKAIPPGTAIFADICRVLVIIIKTLTTPNLQKKYLKKFSTVGNCYFHLFKWGKITTWQEVQAISAEYEWSTKMHGAFWRHISKSALMDFAGFRKVPGQSA